jgi:UDP-N-acetylglucosamine kinase
MTEKEVEVAEKAKKYIKKNKKNLIKKFADPNIYVRTDRPISLFMAGSPGAGKTEVSKGLVNTFAIPTVRIDADEIRAFIPGYIPKKAYIMHGAASLGVEKLIDSCFHNCQSFILDGMLSNFDRAVRNIDNCLLKNRLVIIFYVYQDPKIAWKFTQDREKVEGRNIPKDVFIHGFLESRNVAQLLKDKYGDGIELNVIEKDYDNATKEIWSDVDRIDKYIEKVYSGQDLEDVL